MKYFGVVYDVGLRVSGTEKSTVEPFDPALVEYDMRAIANDLHANAVRIEGEEIDRLLIASRAAHQNGLAIFFSPWKMDAGFEETRAYVAKAAAAAEQLRSEGADVVFVTGCEYTIFSDGIYPGSSVFERSAWVYDQLDDFGGWPNTPQGLPGLLPEKAVELNKVLAALAETARASFGGPLTYSAAIFEEVDWTIFDIAGPNYYRETQSDEDYVAGLEYFRSFGRPVAVPEFGCCAYEGGAARGARGWRVMQGINPDGSGNFADGVVPTRSEREQADYIERQLTVFADQDVHAAFVFVWAQPGYPTGEGAKDLDMACYSIVKVFPDDDPRSQQIPNWEPKESFRRAAEFFQKHAAGTGH